MSVILKAENISKQYRLGLVGTGTLSDDLKRWWYNVRGKEDPFLKVGAVNARDLKATQDYVWALRDINFEVKQGEVLGIIGKNGAGKSTLLKLLSRVTSPTIGSIRSRGRIASLLEIGTGFHPELTGRENIFMNGAVLGMTRAEIKNKLDEIIAFSGCEMYIDTPVKRYSSGMTVRLGFAVAAHLEPEILVIDEVLAVGDAEFQKRAIGKMQDLSTGEGRTVLFVSHNMISVQNLCDRVLVLEDGCINFDGSTETAVAKYLYEPYINEKRELNISCEEDIGVIAAIVKGSHEKDLSSGNNLKISVKVKNLTCQKLNLHLGIYDEKGEKQLHLSNLYDPLTVTIVPKEYMIFNCIIEENPLNFGVYFINISLHVNDVRFQHIKRALVFTISESDFYKTGKIPPKQESKFLIKQQWQIS